MMVYVDGNDKYLIYGNSLDTYIRINKRGPHTVVMKAWEDVPGVIFQSSVTVTTVP